MRTARNASFARPWPTTPNDYDANYYLASILAVRQRPVEARPLADHALQLRPGSEDDRKLLAEIEQPGGTPPPADASPLLGKAAPDVELRRPEGGTFRLSSLRGQPVLLAFGSYTCPQLRHRARSSTGCTGASGSG